MHDNTLEFMIRCGYKMIRETQDFRRGVEIIQKSSRRRGRGACLYSLLLDVFPSFSFSPLSPILLRGNKFRVGSKKNLIPPGQPPCPSKRYYS